MEDNTLIGILVTLVGALGTKEVWNIWKKKIDVQAKKDLISLSKEHQVLHGVIEEQRSTIEDNKECAVKLARMEERLLLSAKQRSTRKQKSKNGTTND